MYNASLLWKFLNQQINGCVTFIGTTLLPLKVSSQEIEEEVWGCALAVIRYKAVALGYYSLIYSK